MIAMEAWDVDSCLRRNDGVEGRNDGWGVQGVTGGGMQG